VSNARSSASRFKTSALCAASPRRFKPVVEGFRIVADELDVVHELQNPVSAVLGTGGEDGKEPPAPLEESSMSDDIRAIRKLIDRWMKASQAGDTAAVLSMMTDDVLFMTCGREPFGKEEFAASASAMKDMRIDGTADVKEVAVTGDWAWARTYLSVTMTTPDGKETRRSGYTLSIFSKEMDGTWRIARDANLLRTAAPTA
jgi:uncharacterized protein (TIGR02246 family)